MRVALIGAGAIGRTHAETVAGTDGFELGGIADPFDAGRDLAALYDTAHHRDHRALIDAEHPEAAIIATPNELHVAQALDFIAAGIPVLVEKPVAPALSSARELAEASAAAGVPVLVGHHRRHHPVTVRAKELISSGALGTVVAVSVTSFLSKPDEYFDVPWHRTIGTGGTFLINLIHEIDLLRHLIGEITSVSVLASSATRALDVEDTGALAFAFASGALATLIISDTVAGPWSWDLTAGDSPRFPTHAVESHRIGGIDASLTLPTLGLWRHGGERTWTTPLHREPAHPDTAGGAADPYRRQLAHFGDVVSGAASPLVSALEGARNVAVMEAVSQSVTTGATARVPTV